ncbi:hypothetical protein [Vulcanisaeta thermophila]|uniref:hypothetical protein n=1 Tax=Vulcanisaeta thermophila TaxID=867917 RepID=UPI0008538560|nr:hypothetical protein [Vulcanisaeta thermophila]
MGRVVYVRRFLPFNITVGQLTRTIEFEAALNRLDDALNKVFDELSKLVGGVSVKQVGLSISNVTLGNVSGILIIAYALIDGDG